MAMHPLTIELFGGLRVRPNGQPSIEVPRRQSSQVLAYLALFPGRTHSRDALATVFWCDSDSATARTRLRQEIVAVRKLLEPDGAAGSILTCERDTVAFVPGVVATDVVGFEALLAASGASADDGERERVLAEAVGLYRGELLPGYDFDGLEAERARLAHAYETALRELARLQQARGDMGAAETSLRRLIAENPYLEEGHVDLMRLFAAQGMPTRVREQYRELERALREEFDAEPTEATRELARRLCREADPAAAAGGGPVVVDCRPSGADPTGSAHAGREQVGPQPMAAPAGQHGGPTARRLGSAGIPASALGPVAMMLAVVCFVALAVRRAPGRHAAARTSGAHPASAAAPDPVEWTYGYAPRPGEKADSEPKSLICSGSSVFVTGLVQTDKEDADILTLKLSEQGKLLWARRYSEPEHDCDRAFSMCPDGEGGVYVAGESYVPAGPGRSEGWHLVLIRYGGDGRELWVGRSRDATLNTDARVCVCALSGRCAVAGSALIRGKQHLLVECYDRAGRLLWSHTSAGTAHLTNLAAGDGFYACGITGSEKDAGLRPDWIVARFDLNGRRAWERTIAGPGYGGGPSFMVPDRDRLLVAGAFDTGSLARGGHGPNPAIALLDPRTAHVAWTKWETNDSYGYEMRGIAYDPPGLWLFGNRTSAVGTIQSEVGRYDGAGQVVWRRIYDSPPFRAQRIAANHGGILAVLLTGAVQDLGGTTVVMGINDDGKVSYRCPTHATTIGFDSPRAIDAPTDHIIYVAAQSNVPDHRALTVTKLHLR